MTHLLALLLTSAALLANPALLHADEFVTPFDFGAAGDGAADDTSAFTQALATGKIVSLQGGKFRLTSRMVVNPGSGVVGPGEVIQDFDVLPPDPPSDSGVVFFTTGDGVRFENFKLTKPFTDGSYAYGIVANSVEDLKIHGMDISGYSARYGIHIIESKSFEVSNCYIHDFMVNTTTDMIADSPAGLRITRSRDGIVSNNRIERIEVGPEGLTSISPLVPDYGPQGYQSDHMTIVQCQNVTIEGNICITSGEGIDMLLSDSCVLSANIIKDIWFQGFKMLGVSYCSITGNFFSDCYQGVGLAYHGTFDKDASGNTIVGNVFRNIGSPGSFGIPAAGRVNFGSPVAIDVHDIECRDNIISLNNVIDTQETPTTSQAVNDAGSGTLSQNNRFVTSLKEPQ